MTPEQEELFNAMRRAADGYVDGDVDGDDLHSAVVDFTDAVQAPPRPLTDNEREVFEAIRHAPNIALIQTQFDGEATAVITAVNRHGKEFHVTPLAVLVTDAITARLTDPTQD